MYEGVIDDPYGEFLIEENKTLAKVPLVDYTEYRYGLFFCWGKIIMSCMIFFLKDKPEPKLSRFYLSL